MHFFFQNHLKKQHIFAKKVGLTVFKIHNEADAIST